MRIDRRKADWPIVAASIAIVVTTAVGLYAWGYLAMGASLGDANLHSLGPTTIRYFDARWKVLVFRPAGKIEAILIGKHVMIAGPPQSNHFCGYD